MAYMAIVYCVHFKKYYRSSPKFLSTFHHTKSYALILARYGLGYILGDFLHTHLVTLLRSKGRNGGRIINTASMAGVSVNIRDYVMDLSR
jgi:NAD(P)-dependent dehydrogenase (short-subunit alcohol dehydrogenase family)